jgi:hypothetical protein
LKLLLQREELLPLGTPGSLSVDGAPFCVTLERPAPRFHAQYCCVENGEYGVLAQYSPHFGRVMPTLQNVADRSGIEIHWGNFVDDYQGCIGVGASGSRMPADMPGGEPCIWSTRATFDVLFARIARALAAADAVTIAILDPVPTLLSSAGASS